MTQQRISYVPLEKMDARMRAEMERCEREGTPRPESSAIRAHVPACFWFFAESWNNVFRNGILDHAVKELCRLLGGEIRFDSQEGEGTIFVITFPLRLSIQQV